MARIYNGTSSDHLDTSAAAISAYGFTASVWVRLDPAQVGVQSNAIFTAVGTSAANNNRFCLGIATTGAVTAWEQDTTGNSANSTTFITDFNWHNITGTFETASLRHVWLDGFGRQVSSTAKTTTFGAISRLGSGPNGANAFTGTIAHATIWNVVLADTDIALLGTNPPWAVATSNIVDYWPDPTNTSPVTSLGSTPHSMTVTGTTYTSDNPAFSTPRIPVITTGGNRVQGRGPMYQFRGLQPSNQPDFKPSTIPPQVGRQLGLGPFYRGPAISFLGLQPGQPNNLTSIALVGNASLFTHAVGDSAGAAAASGVSLVSSSLDALLGGSGALSGTDVSSSVATGDVRGAAALAGAAAMASSLAANLGGVMALSGTAATTRNLTGAVTGAAALSGAASSFSSMTGSVSGALAASGSSVAASSLLGAIGGSGALSGSSATATHLIGNLALNLALTGVGSTSATLAGALTGAGALQGSSITALEARGAMIGDGALQGYLSAGSWLIGNLALNLIGSGIACYTSDSWGAMTGLASLAATNPALAAFISGQMTGAMAASGSSAAFTHARGNLSTGIITSFQRVWVGDAVIAGTSQSVAVFSN